MPRRNKHDNYRTRGGNNDRGRGQGRGHGRGGPNHVPRDAVPTFAATDRAPRHRYSHTNAEIDVVIQRWPESLESTIPGPGANGVGNMNRGNGSWRGGTPQSRSGAGTPRGWSRGRGRGRGRGSTLVDDRAPRRPHFGVGASGKPKTKPMIGKDAPLSGLLYAERPLLRPVKFVRATLTPFLFQDSEDVLKPAADVADSPETSHVPTADRVAQLFHQTETEPGPDIASDADLESDSHADGLLEEIDFADLARMRAEVDAIAQGIATATMHMDVHEDENDIEEVDFADLAAIRAKVDAAEPPEFSQDEVIEETFTGVYNKIKDTTHVLSNTNVIEDDKPSVGQQTLPSSTSPTHGDILHFKPSIKISDSFIHKPFTQSRDTIIIEEESSNGLPHMPIDEPSPSIHPTLVTVTVTVPPDDIPIHSDAPSHDGSRSLFVIDTTPTHPLTNNAASDVILVDRAGHGETLGDQDEELIVYPRSRYTSESPASAVPRVKLPQTSMLTGRAAEVSAGGLRSPVREDDNGLVMVDRDDTRGGLDEEVREEPQLSLASLTLGPAAPTRPSRTTATRRASKKAKLQQQRQRQNKPSSLGFGEFGAMMSEVRLKEEDARERRRPRWATRRRGDSDLDWGTDGDQDEKKEVEVVDDVGVLSDSLGGMEIDPDLELDVDAMQGFLSSMSVGGSPFLAMNDIADEGGLGGPDGSSDSELSDEEDAEVDDGEVEDEVFNLEEQRLIAESEDEEELSGDSDDDKASPGSSFQARLRKIREQSRAKHPKAAQELSDDEEEENAPTFSPGPGTRSANDEEFIAHIQNLLEQNSQILSGRDRKQKKAVFRNLHQGHVDVEEYLDDPEYTTPVNKKKDKRNKGKEKQLPWHVDAKLAAHLETQWAKDRAKKAARKWEREQARALDPLSVDTNKRNKKDARASRKAMHMVVDVVSLEARMRRFVEDRSKNGDADKDGGKGEGKPCGSMALPPMDRQTRKVVHELAAAFGIKSVSKGRDMGRYTTLIRTARTGVGVNEQKVSALMKRFGAGKRGRGGDGGWMPKHREGDEVGKEAPKIGESNIGFKMLASMGWSEGDRIGSTASVGIEAPLTAIMKRSKLGLGATR